MEREEAVVAEKLAFRLPDLALQRFRFTLRLLEDAAVPVFKGALLRGGFGYAFQRASCPQACWKRSDECAVSTVCPYRWVFETPRPPGIEQLHDLQDVPRPFVIKPPLDGQTYYAAGSILEFQIVLIGRGTDYVPYFLYSFEQFGQLGLGKNNARFRLEQVEALQPWQPVGTPIYNAGRVVSGIHTALPEYTAAAIQARAAALPADLRLTLRTPLRVKARGALIEQIDLPAIVQSLCWRLHTLSLFHGPGTWEVDHRALVAQAREVRIEQPAVQWKEWTRTSGRGGRGEKMEFGGLLGNALLRNVSTELRALLLAGSLVHIGKTCVFGNGWVEVGSL
jgi:hypothetical protein